MLGNARAYRLHPVAATSTPDAWLQLITRKPSIEAGYGEMQYAIALQMKYKRLRYSHSLAEAVVSQKQFMTALS